MPPITHAILSVSSSNRWLHCMPSVRLCESYEGNYAADGTDTHELCEYKLKKALRIKAKDPTENLTRFNEEMEESANGYASYIMELVEEAKKTSNDPAVLIEQRVDFSRWVEQGFWTSDAILISDGTMHIIDHKYGLGVMVSADENPQIKLFSRVFLELLDDIYDINMISITIYKPRWQNIATFTISKEELFKLDYEVLKPTAEISFAEDGNFMCGEWCKFCKSKYECRARSELNFLLAQYDFNLPPLLEDTEIAGILLKADDLVLWVNDIKEYALQQAISGKELYSWKLVEGRSNCKHTNDVAVVKAVEDTGFDPYENKMLTITAIQKKLGKSKFDELLSGLIEKPQGKSTLVPENDKRLAMNTARNHFMEEM